MLGDRLGFHSVLDGRAPLPRGVLALLEPRGALRRDRGAHREHPHRLRRAAAAEAVQPPDPHRRVGRGARPDLRRARRVRHRPLVDPRRARGLQRRSRTRRARCGARRCTTSSARGRRSTYQADGKYWQMGAPRRVQPKPLQQPHPPIWGATSSPDGHREIGRHGIGLCSFTVGVPPEELGERHRALPRRPRRVRAAGRQVRQRPGRDVHDGALRADERAGGRGRGRVVRLVREARRRAHRHRSPSCSRARTSARTSTRPRRCRWTAKGSSSTSRSTSSATSGSAVVGDPDQCIAAAKRYEAIGCDLLLCLVNPYKIPHDKVMESIELLGKHVLPAFAD